MRLIYELEKGEDQLPLIPIKGQEYSKIEITSPEQFSQIMAKESLIRKRVIALDNARGQIRSKCHTVYVLELRHKISLLTSYLFFVRLFASDKEGQTRTHV